MDYSLRPVSFEDLEGWGDDDPTALIGLLQDCLEHVTSVKAYRGGSLGLTTGDLLPLLTAASTFEPTDAASVRDFFRQHCIPFRIAKADGKSGFVTGFYEPEIEVSATPDDIWRFPLYRRPDDLVDVNDENRPEPMESTYVFGLDRDGVILSYPDRQAIDQGCLSGRGLEIAWAKSKVDVFFFHVQGAARLIYPDGRIGRITYAAKAGHAFSPIGKKLIDIGEIKPADISMQSIRAWLGANPDRVDEILWHNRSYIFFREADATGPELGPIAAAKIPLVAGRSLAVDRLIHTFGCPFFIQSKTLMHLDDGKPFRRLMLALDTGSAIVGPARGDIFTGSGAQAGEQAGTIRNAADFYILIPKAAAERFV